MIEINSSIIDSGYKLVQNAEKHGVDWVEVRIEDTTFEYIHYLNNRVKEANINRYIGIGIRTMVKNSLGFSSTSTLDRDRMDKALEESIKIARLSNNLTQLTEEKPRKKRYISRNYKNHPMDISFKEKLDIIKTVYNSAFESSLIHEHKEVRTKDLGVSLAGVVYGAYYGDILIITNEGIEVATHQILTGLRAMVIVEEGERRGDGHTYLGTSRGMDKLLDTKKIESLGAEATARALEKASAEFAPAGYRTVITSPGISGVFAHESFGHMSEGDFAVSKTTPLVDRIGEELGTEYVSIYDAGNPPYEEGYYYPVDSEGVETKTVTLIEKGIFKGFMHSRETASVYNVSSTGNGRAENYSNPQIVRMRNTYFGPSDWTYEEMIKETREGLLVDDERGGEAHLDGTFTFTASRGYLIERGEITKPVRDIILTGQILDLLKNVDAASNEVKILALPFGGCGKSGQLVYIGLGGPYLRVSRLQIGGR